MSYDICLANLDSDRDEILSTLRGVNATRRFDQRVARFDHVYKDNPDGQGLLWIVRDSHGNLIGKSGAVPRQLYVGEMLLTGYVLIDTWIHPDHRVLGPAMLLLKASLEHMNAGHMDFCAEISKGAMDAIWKRLGVEPCGNLVRYSKPLRLDWYLERHLQSAWLAKCISPVGNLLLKARDAFIRPNSSLEISIQEEECGEEFTQLVDRLGPNFGFCMRRTAEFLNWSYRGHCYYSHQIITARRNGELVGYCVLSNEDPVMNVVDILTEDDPTTIYGLFAKVVEISRRRNSAMSIWVSLLESSGSRHLPQRAGLSVRNRDYTLKFYARDQQLAERMTRPGHLTWSCTS